MRVYTSEKKFDLRMVPAKVEPVFFYPKYKQVAIKKLAQKFAKEPRRSCIEESFFSLIPL